MANGTLKLSEAEGCASDTGKLLDINSSKSNSKIDAIEPASLTRIGILSALSAPELEQIFAHVQPKHLEGGRQYIEEDLGEPAVFLLWSGRCRVVLMSQGGENVTVRSIRPGGVFGEISLLAGVKSAPYHLVIDEDCLTLRIAGDDFSQFMKAMPSLQNAVMRNVAQTAMERADRIFEFALFDSRMRLYAEILRLAKHGRRVGDRIIVSPFVTHEAIATQIGTRREGVSRNLKLMAQEGLISCRRGELVVLDLPRLRAAVATAVARSDHYLSA